jgi:predicted  nucleic acid-binding Zn-ribbon protein
VIIQWIAIGVSCIGLFGIFFLWIDRVKKKDPELIDRAMRMVELSDRKGEELTQRLVQADDTIKNLNFQLVEANNEITKLKRELHEARGEVIMLQTQVRMMTQRVERENND